MGRRLFCLCMPQQTCTYGLLLHIVSKRWAVQRWEGGRLRRTGLGVQPLEEPLAQALGHIAAGQPTSGFLALLGHALERSMLEGGLLGLFTAFWGKKIIARHTTLY